MSPLESNSICKQSQVLYLHFDSALCFMARKLLAATLALAAYYLLAGCTSVNTEAINNRTKKESIELNEHSYLELLADSTKASPEELRELISDSHATCFDPRFSRADIADFVVWEVPAEYANSLAGSMDAKLIVEYFRCGIPRENAGCFDDTEKPNALVAIAMADAVDAFRTEEAIELNRRIAHDYDALFIFADSEDDLYATISNMKDLSLVLLEGHGSQTTLTFWDSCSDMSRLDTEDWELRKYFGRLPDKCRICLMSCSTGSGEFTELNLANFIFLMSGGNQVTAPIKPVEVSELVLYADGSASFRDGRTSRDLTYVPNNAELDPKLIREVEVRERIFGINGPVLSLR